VRSTGRPADGPLPADQKVGSPGARYAEAREASASQEIETTSVSVPKHFEHSNVRESKPGLSGSMTRNVIFTSHFGHLGLLIWSTNIAYPPLGRTNHLVAALCAYPMFGR
jgi:hypothetical protein